jgi:hypothetical protein
MASGASKGTIRASADPRAARTFWFTTCAYDRATGVARLGYRFDTGPELVERVTFPHAPWPSEPSRQAAFLCALDLLHAMAGVSYYKAGLPPALRFEQPGIGSVIGNFLRELYVGGLAELGYVNGIDIAERVRFPPPGSVPQEAPVRLDLPARTLVAVGGGKDSLVGLDLARRAGLEPQAITVGVSPLIGEMAGALRLPLLRIRRELAPELRAMNRAGAWNGHVPVTAINSGILLCAALLYGYRQVVFSNERSADEATLTAADGREINHQFSKSSAFEATLRHVLMRTISPDLEYFSILRPFSELAVVQQFSTMTNCHAVFSSCNRHFHIDGPRVRGRWCGDCPKCRFAALSLAVFLQPSDVVAIQDADLLDDQRQVEGFRALCRLGRDKPFECVGEAGESRAALDALRRDPAWRERAVVRSLAPELEQVEVPAMADLLRPRARHFIPSAICARLGLPESSDVAG